MEITLLDGVSLKEMILSGARRLHENKEHVDALNVFPVPDGDTGTNMSLTLSSAAKEVQNIDSNSVGVVADAAARGSLMGARGNSGVILSQLIRGISKELKNTEEIDTQVFAKALENGVNTAYKAVMKPMEGTILTVAREAAKAAIKESKKDKNLVYVFQQIITKANNVLNQTPDMLPVLKQAGVVDAGGKGWVLFLEGMFEALTGQQVMTEDYPLPEVKTTPGSDIVPASEGTIEFAYCTELFILNAGKGEEKVRSYLTEMGDSLLVVGHENTVKVHIHTNHPGQVLEKCLEFGALEGIKIENMVIQNMNLQADDETEPDELKPYGFIAVSSGDGLTEIFKSLGVDEVVAGGQTNNPSTEDLVNAIEAIKAEVIYILPNNGNIVLTANQAAKLVNQKVEVIPTKTMPQGIAAMVAFQPEKDIETNCEKMTDAAQSVATGEVTYAVRDTSIGDTEIKKDDIIGIANGEIIAVGNDKYQVTIDLISSLIDDESELVTLYAGEDTSEEEIESLMDNLEEKFPDIDFEQHMGGQPLYYFLISVE